MSTNEHFLANSAWLSPSPESVSTLTETPTPTQHGIAMSDFHPRYASAIGLSIFPGQTQVPVDQASNVSTLLANNQHPYSMRGTLTSVTATTSFPASTQSNLKQETVVYSTAGGTGNLDGMLNVSDATKPSSASQLSTFSQSGMNRPIQMTAQDLNYPLSQVTPTNEAVIANRKTQISHVPPAATLYQENASNLIQTVQDPIISSKPNLSQGLQDAVLSAKLSSMPSYQLRTSSAQTHPQLTPAIYNTIPTSEQMVSTVSQPHTPAVSTHHSSQISHQQTVPQLATTTIHVHMPTIHQEEASQHTNPLQVSSGPIPVPAIRTVFPKNTVSATSAHNIKDTNAVSHLGPYSPAGG